MDKGWVWINVGCIRSSGVGTTYIPPACTYRSVIGGKSGGNGGTCGRRHSWAGWEQCDCVLSDRECSSYPSMVTAMGLGCLCTMVVEDLLFISSSKERSQTIPCLLAQPMQYPWIICGASLSEGNGLGLLWLLWPEGKILPWRIPRMSSSPWTPLVNPICNCSSSHPKGDVRHSLKSLNSTCVFSSVTERASVTVGIFSMILSFCDLLSCRLLYWLLLDIFQHLGSNSLSLQVG